MYSVLLPPFPPPSLAVPQGLAVCLEMHLVLRSALGAGLDVMTIGLQLQCLLVTPILFLVLQNASLAVLQDTEVGSMDSWDSSWGQEALEPASTHSSWQSLEVNQETWLMLDYCDKGSLLVSKPLLGGMGDACRVELVQGVKYKRFMRSTVIRALF